MARSVPVLVVLALLALSCGPDTAPPRHTEIAFLAAPSGAARSLPFSEAARAGDFLFLSGQVGTLPGTLQLAPGGIDAEAGQAMRSSSGSGVKELGELLYRDYLVPFEIASVILLVGLVGAVMLAKKNVKE